MGVIARLCMFDNQQADVVEQLLSSDKLTKAVQDRLANPIGHLSVACHDGAAQSFNAIRNPGAVYGLRDSVGEYDHDVARPQRYSGLANESGDLFFQPQRKTEI